MKIHLSLQNRFLVTFWIFYAIVSGSYSRYSMYRLRVIFYVFVDIPCTSSGHILSTLSLEIFYVIFFSSVELNPCDILSTSGLL